MQTLHDSLRTYAEDLKKVSDAQRDATISMVETKQTIATGGVQNTSTAKNSALNYNNMVLNAKNKAYSTATRSATSNVNKLAGSANYGLSHGKIANNKKYNTILNNIKGCIKKRVAIPDSLLAIVAKKNVTLYNRLYMYNLGIENLKTAREEYITAYSANSAEKYNNIADKYKNLDDATNDAMDLYNSKSSNSVYAKNKNSYLDKQKSGYGSIVNRDVSERNKYASAVSSYKKIMSKSARGTSLSALSIKSRSVVRKCVDTAKSYARHNKDIPDSIIGKLSEYVTKGYISSSFLYACINYNNTLESYNQAKAQAEIDKQTQITQRAEIASQKFSNIATEYDNKRHTYEQTATELNNKMSILEAKGNGASDVWYQRLYTNEQKTNSNLVSKRKDLIDSLNKSVKNGDIQKYSTEWYNLRSQIDDVTNSIDESTKSLQEYQNQMEQIKWDRIDEGVQKIQNFIDANDFMINELSRRDLTSDDIGGLTKEGDAVAGLHIANYKAYQEQAQSYANAITDINKKLADDPYNQRYIEQKEKLVKSYQDCVKGAEDEKFSVISLIEDGYNALSNKIKDLISDYTDLLDKQSDAYSYSESINEKTKTLSDLRKQLVAISGDTSEETRAKTQELNKSLKDAEKDLKDTQYDKLISSTKDMLSDFQTDLDDSIQDIIKNLDVEFSRLIASIDEKWGTSREIKQLDIKKRIKELDKAGYGFETRNKVRILLVDIFNKAMINEYINKNPAKGIILKRDEEKEMRVLSTDEQTIFFDCCKGTFYDNLFVVAVTTGMRIGELAGLKWSDIDLDKKQIHVNRTLVYQKYDNDTKKEFHIEEPKTMTSKRVIPINKQCEIALKKQYMQKNVIAVKAPKCKIPQDEFKDFIFTTKFNTPLNSQIVCDAIKKIVDEVNLTRDILDEIEPFSAHCFRHTFATRCFEAGIQPKTVQAYLGHATIQMTMDLYTAVMPKHLFNEMEKVEILFDSVADNGDSIVEQKFANSKSLDNNIIRFNGDSKVV